MGILYTSTQLSGTSLPEVNFPTPGGSQGLLFTNNSVWSLTVFSSIWSVNVPPLSIATMPSSPNLPVTVKGVTLNQGLNPPANSSVTWGSSQVSTPLTVSPIASAVANSIVPTGTGAVYSVTLTPDASGSASQSITLCPSGQVRIIGLLNLIQSAVSGKSYVVTVKGQIQGKDSLTYFNTTPSYDLPVLAPVAGGPDLVDTLVVSISTQSPIPSDTVTVTLALDGNAVPNVTGTNNLDNALIYIVGPSGTEVPGANDPTSNKMVTMPVGGGTQGEPVPTTRQYVSGNLPATLATGTSTIVTSSSVFTAGTIFLALTNTGSSAATVTITDGNDVGLATLTSSLAANATGYYLCIVSGQAVTPSTLFNIAPVSTYKIHTTEPLTVVSGPYNLLEG